MYYLLIVLSLILESCISNFTFATILVPLFLLTSFTILHPYYKNNKINFILSAMFFGLIYDIAFTDLVFINTICFGICSIFVVTLYKYIKYNIFNANLINIIVIIIYRIISYIFLIILDYVNFCFLDLLKGIYSSILINIVYGTILFLVSKCLNKKIE